MPVSAQVSTRLPAPEANFQNSQPISTDSLPEALTKDASTMLSPFGHSAQSLYGAPPGVVQRERQGAARVLGPLRVAGFRYRETHKATRAGARDVTVERDPMLFFTHMLAYSAIICLGGTVQGMP